MNARVPFLCRSLSFLLLLRFVYARAQQDMCVNRWRISFSRLYVTLVLGGRGRPKVGVGMRGLARENVPFGAGKAFASACLLGAPFHEKCRQGREQPQAQQVIRKEAKELMNMHQMEVVNRGRRIANREFTDKPRFHAHGLLLPLSEVE